jgi:hypothetical protein
MSPDPVHEGPRPGYPLPPPQPPPTPAAEVNPAPPEKKHGVKEILHELEEGLGNAIGEAEFGG